MQQLTCLAPTLRLFLGPHWISHIAPRPLFLVIATEFQSISTATQSSLVPGEDTSGVLFQSLQLWRSKWAAELDQGVLGTQQETYSVTRTIIEPSSLLFGTGRGA